MPVPKVGVEKVFSTIFDIFWFLVREDPIMSRRWHRSVAGVLLLPLLLTATTGMVYRFCRGVLGVPGEQMSVCHQ